MKVIIAGSRGFTDYPLLRSKMDRILSETDAAVEIISGGARGADRLGERYAQECGYPVIRVPAEWDKHGKSAGFKRNQQMASIATHVVLFWDGESPGTKSMLSLAVKAGLPVRVIRVRCGS